MAPGAGLFYAQHRTAETIPAGEGTLEVIPASTPPATETPKQLPTWLTKTEAAANSGDG